MTDYLIGDRMRSARLRLKLSQTELAEEVALRIGTWTQTTVSRTERSERDMTAREAPAVAEVLGVPVLWLIGVHDD